MWVKRPIHWIALVVGITGAFVEGLSNIDDIAKKVGSLYDPGVFAAAITSVGAAVLLAFVIRAFSQKHLLVGIGLLTALIFTAGYTVSTTLTRTSEARAKALNLVFQKDAQYQELFKVYSALAARSASECGVGAGPKCQANREALYLSQGKLKERETELDAMGQQVKWMLSPFIDVSVETAGRIQPMFLPMALFLLSMFCVAFGERGEWQKPEFDVGLKGKEAEDDKAARYIASYKAAHGKLPPAAEVSKVASISEWRARKALDKAA